MALSTPRAIFGVHEFTPYSRVTGLPFGTARVLGSSSLALSGELIKLNGGSNKYAWDVQDGLITAELSILMREIPDFATELFLGKQLTSNAAETGGSVTTIANQNGISVVATTGLASVGVLSGSEDDVKFSKYVVRAVSATTVDVYALTDLDFARGVDKVFEDDTLKITASALTIITATPVTIPDFGLELTGDSGTIALVTGDTATFSARPINTASIDVSIGATNDIFPEFGAIVVAEKQGTGRMFEIDLKRVKAIGLPLGFDEKAFSESEVTAEAFYDSVLNKVMDIREVIPTTVN